MSITVQTFDSSTQVAAKEYLRTLLIPTYYASYSPQPSDTNWDLYYDSDNNLVFQFYAASNDVGIECAFYITQSEYYHCRHNPSYSYGGQSGTVSKIISCDGGILILADGIGLIITKSNQGKTCVIGSCNYQTGNSGQQYKYQYVYSTTYGDVSLVPLHFSPQWYTQVQLIPFITNNGYGNISYTKNAFWIPFGEFYQYTSGYKFVGPDDYEYVTNGYWAIRDKSFE